MKAILAGALLWLLGAGGAAAGEWYWVVSSRDAVVAVDWSSIRLLNGNRRAWTVSAYKTAGANDYDYALAFYEFDCDASRQQLLVVNFYKAGGEPEGHGRPRDWEFPAPDSIVYGLMESVCSDEPPPGESFETAAGFARWVRNGWEDQ